MKNLRQMISNGEPVVGIFSIASTPAVVEMIGYAGFDFVIIDTEHVALSPFGSDLESCIRGAYAADIIPLVRVAEISKSMIQKALNFGAKGIVAPHVNTKDDAERLVASARYWPEGHRSAAPPVRAAHYGWTLWSDFWKRSNEEVLVIPLLEERQGIENLTEIVSVPGIDIIYFGPFDLSMTLGLGGIMDHPTINQYFEKTINICKQRGMPVMTAGLALDMEDVKKSLKRGCSALVLAVDMVLLNNVLRNLEKNVRDEIRPLKLR